MIWSNKTGRFLHKRIVYILIVHIQIFFSCFNNVCCNSICICHGKWNPCISSITFNWHKTSFEGERSRMKNHICKSKLIYPALSIFFVWLSNSLVDLHYCANSFHIRVYDSCMYIVPSKIVDLEYQSIFIFNINSFLWFICWSVSCYKRMI